MDDLPFGQLLRRHRERLLLTQEQLAVRAKLSARAVRGIESGDVRSPRARSVSLLSEALMLQGPEREVFQAGFRAQATASSAESSRRLSPGGRVGLVPNPSLLPLDIPDLTGRDDLVRGLVDLLPGGGRESSAPTAPAVVVLAVAGRAGIGKTTLAVHVAHQLRSRFPDGQLYVNLRGAHSDPLDPSKVLGRFLRALGQDGGAIPSGLEERAELYRGLLADRHVLVLLDDAASEAQVRPLLPGSATSAVLVTSRGRLAALEGAHLVELDVLERAQAVALLARIAGARRVAAEPQAAEAIVAWCGLLPLAVRIAGAKLAARPHWALARLEGLLSDERRRLDQLAVGDLEVRASVALSYAALSEEERTAFRRLALLRAPDFAGWVAAPLLDVAAAQAEEVLDRLVQAQLLDTTGDGGDGQPRYRFHDLLRVYARERARLEEPADQRDAALSRALGAWLALAEQADQMLPNGSAVLSRGSAPRWWLDRDRQAALLADPVAWLETERHALLTAVEQAALSTTAGMDELAWELAASLSAFFELRSYFDEWRSSNAISLATTRRTGNSRGQIAALTNLASSLEYDQGNEAARLFEEACRLAKEIGDAHAEACTLVKLVTPERYNRGRPLVALERAERAVAMLTRLGDGRRLGYALYERGTVHLELGSDIMAEADLDHALSLLQQADQRGVAQVLRRLGIMHMERGELELATSRLEQGLELCRTLRDTLGEAYTLESLGGVWAKRADFIQARTLLDKAYQEFQRTGILRGQGITMRALGELHASQGRPDQALACMQHALNIWQQLDMPGEIHRTEQLILQLGH